MRREISIWQSAYVDIEFPLPHSHFPHSISLSLSCSFSVSHAAEIKLMCCCVQFITVTLEQQWPKLLALLLLPSDPFPLGAERVAEAAFKFMPLTAIYRNFLAILLRFTEWHLPVNLPDQIKRRVFCLFFGIQIHLKAVLLTGTANIINNCRYESFCSVLTLKLP